MEGRHQYDCLSFVFLFYHSTRTFKRINEVQTLKNVEGVARIILNDFLGHSLV